MVSYIALQGTKNGAVTLHERGEYMDIQLKRGTLELCVLSLLSKQDLYGYRLVSEISSNIKISEGTIYPLLKRLKDDNLVTAYLRESQEGPPRKYYSITPDGRVTLEKLKSDWLDLVESVRKICG